MPRSEIRFFRSLILLPAWLALTAWPAVSQSRAVPAETGPAGNGWSAELRITDPRLRDALAQLVAASPTAARIMEALERSRLPVTIGTPPQLAALPDSAGGPCAEERRALLTGDEAAAAHGGTAVASVVFRADAAGPAHGSAESLHVERVWIAVEVDSVEHWIRRGRRADAEMRIRQDLLAILAHEFVAHVGSIAETRRFDDLCEDPTAEQRRRSALARGRGEAPPLDGEMAACALRMENRVRRELNASLGWRGSRSLPPRHHYTLDVMHFAAEHGTR